MDCLCRALLLKCDSTELGKKMRGLEAEAMMIRRMEIPRELRETDELPHRERARTLVEERIGGQSY